LYIEEDSYTDSVGGHFHRIFSKTDDTESFAGPVGDALKAAFFLPAFKDLNNL
jgi:hypothetical protein